MHATYWIIPLTLGAAAALSANAAASVFPIAPPWFSPVGDPSGLPAYSSMADALHSNPGKAGFQYLTPQAASIARMLEGSPEAAIAGEKVLPSPVSVPGQAARGGADARQQLMDTIASAAGPNGTVADSILPPPPITATQVETLRIADLVMLDILLRGELPIAAADAPAGTNDGAEAAARPPPSAADRAREAEKLRYLLQFNNGASSLSSDTPSPR